jgi:hypothetical protein
MPVLSGLLLALCHIYVHVAVEVELGKLKMGRRCLVSSKVSVQRHHVDSTPQPP